MPKQFVIEQKIIFEPETFRLIAKNKNKELILSSKESSLLSYLCESSMMVINRSELIDKIWGGGESSDVGLNKTILHLRRKFESLGIQNSINTISRVGYMLRLRVTINLDTPSLDYIVSDVVSQEQQSGCEKNGTLEDGESREHHLRSLNALSRKNSVSIFLFIIGLMVFIINHYSSKYHEHIFRDLVHTKNANGDVFFTKDVQVTDSLENAIAALNKNRYMLMVSKYAISYIEFNNAKPKLQKLFFVDVERPLIGQMQCVVNNISSGIVDFFNVTAPIVGMDYIRSYIYEPCVDGSKGLGELFIRNTQFPEKTGIGVQNVSLKSINGDVVFDLKEISEYHADFSKVTYVEYNKRKVKHAKTKSILLDKLNQELIQSNPLYARVLEELISKDKYIIAIDDAERVNADSTFGGMLYFR